MDTSKRHIGFAGISFFLLGGCGVGAHHTTDSEMEHNFFAHEPEFRALLAEVNADGKLQMLRDDSVRYAGHTFFRPGDSPVTGGPGLTGEQWARYSRQLRRLGIAQVTKGDGMVEFRVDTGTIWNGSSYKGMWYGEGLREHMWARSGDFLYIPANVPHLPYNPSDLVPCTGVVARTDPQRTGECDTPRHCRPWRGRSIAAGRVDSQLYGSVTREPGAGAVRRSAPR